MQNQEPTISKKDDIKNKFIFVIAFALPLVVTLLYFLPKGESIHTWVYEIPKFNAILNTLTFVTILLGVVAILNGKRVLHRALMFTSFILGSIFLVGYVMYHAQVQSTHFGGMGFIKSIYFFLLISHIVLAASVAPLVLITIFKAVKGDFVGHKKIAKWTYPIWLYVSFTGVIVYLMISPYYIM